ncbi:MAG: large conductance mechanosensitive channel protein MscL [Acidobacteriota bacterium]
MLKGFRDFILRGNVVDLAVAVILGAAFNAIVNSLVADVFNPLIAATVGKPDFSSIVLNIHGGHIKVGNFFNAAVSFLIISTVVYFGIVLPMHYFLQRMKKNDPVPPQPPATKTCTECLSDIPAAAKRCAHCAQPQPVLEPEPVGAKQ